MPAAWQLPPGVSRGLWDYLHDPGIARAYDAQLENTPLLDLDQRFVFEHCPVPGRFLDLGCGTGRLALALAQRGHRVVGVDLSAEMLRAAAEKARRRGADCADVGLVQANVVELDCFADASFDAAACLFGTLGMIAGAQPRRRALGHIQRVLRPDGVFVLHVHNRWHHLGTSSGRRLLLTNLWQSCTGRAVLGDFVMPPHQGIGSVPMHLFTRREIAGLLRGVGFEIKEVLPIGVTGPLRASWWCPRLRAYGYLIAARKDRMKNGE